MNKLIQEDPQVLFLDALLELGAIGGRLNWSFAPPEGRAGFQSTQEKTKIAALLESCCEAFSLVYQLQY